ncbi:aminotransferase class IV [Candidatus Micrarchaeota archaeon]|nr:aminotransferase class IV [Candidatus Micrarchaeota archaeon]
MAGNNNFEGTKRVETVYATTRMLDTNGAVWHGPRFPMDTEARYAYYSRMGGFVPVETAMDTIFTNPIHYGAGGFEGIRMYRTMYGDGFVELSHNLARFIYSSLAFNMSLVRDTMTLFENPNIDYIEHLQRTPREFFADSIKRLVNDEPVQMTVTAVQKDGTKKQIVIPFELKVRVNAKERVFTIREMEATICSIALLNKLVRGGPFPDSTLGLIEGAYFRPVFWVSGEEGLKIPTLIKKDGKLVDKPLYFGVGTLPWGLYLSDEGYKRGLDLLLAPLPRIDSAMPVRQKISGNYVNSARNVNLAAILGFGEVLVLNHRKEIVEGSAENLIFLFTEKKTCKLRAYCPPLSSDILAGTTRDRVLRLLEKGIEVSGQKVELVMEAPTRDEVFDALQGKGAMELSAIVLVGTGVGVIHGRTLTQNDQLRDWLEVNELRSENEPLQPLILRRIEETAITYEINNGEKHLFVDALQMAYDAFAHEENGSRITPAYAMDYGAAERIFGIELSEVASREFRTKVDGGYFHERINGIRQPNEVMAKYREAARVITKMNEKSMEKRRLRL